MDIIYALPAIAITFALGASIGSFLNVIVYRVPAGLSILRPPSRCPYCLTKLKAYENVPVFGWLWLRGRCGHCGHPISPRYPLVEGATGCLFLLILWTNQGPVEVLGYWTFFSWLLALSLIDIDTMTLPNSLTQSGLALGLLFQAIGGVTGKMPVLHGQMPVVQSVSGAIEGLMSGIIGAVIGLWLFELIALVGSIVFGQTAMGGGDAKLAATIGAWLGWQHLLMAGFMACALGAFVGGGAIALGWLDRRQPMPFGPFLAIGAGLTALWGNAILTAYLNLFFPVIP